MWTLKCHELFDGEVINATGETLDKLLKDDLPVVIDFWAPSRPCAVTLRQFEDVAEERSGSPFRQSEYRGGTGTQRPFRYPQHPDDYDFKHGQVVDML